LTNKEENLCLMNKESEISKVNFKEKYEKLDKIIKITSHLIEKANSQDNNCKDLKPKWKKKDVKL